MKPSSEDVLFQHALDRPAAERAAFLDGACLGDAALRQRLEALLAAHDQPETLLATEPIRPVHGIQFADPPDESVGQTLGRYKLLERIGEGGCGVVYVAEQTEPVRRRVALKVIKLGMDTKQVVARFEAERQALAMMNHPNIAKVLDAGTTGPQGQGDRDEGLELDNRRPSATPLPLFPASGRPYFVMELVRGIKITDYCDQANLSTKERLDLFIKVCQAIQHAHQKGIIHRDIKPSNTRSGHRNEVSQPPGITQGNTQELRSPPSLPPSGYAFIHLTPRLTLRPQTTTSTAFLSADLGSVSAAMRGSSVASTPPRRIAKPSR